MLSESVTSRTRSPKLLATTTDPLGHSCRLDAGSTLGGLGEPIEEVRRGDG